MELLINLIPIVIVLAILFMRKHMLFAGLVGALVAMLLAHISVSAAAGMVMSGISTMLSYISPILYAAAAMMVARGGSFKALIFIAQRSLKDKIAIFAGFLVIIQALATYMAGLGAGNTMVIAPLVAAAVGAVPEVVAGMAIATAACFTTSPSSTETILAAESAGAQVADHAATMMPLTIFFVLLGAILAVYGVYKRGTMVKEQETEQDDIRTLATGQLWLRSVPAIALLLMVVFGSKLNGLIGTGIFSPAVNVILTAVLCALLTPLGIDKTCDALGDGSKYILTTLFSVGIFLAFINIIGETGVFEQIAALVAKAPKGIIVPCAILTAFFVAIPSGAFCAGVLTLILPTLSLLGMPSSAMGLVAIAAGFGTQISPVQINVAALAGGFKIDIFDVIRLNLKYIVGALVLLIASSFIFV